jgi:hypothetical protein
MNLFSTVWLFISLFAPWLSHAAPGPSAVGTVASPTASSLQLWREGMRACFDKSQPAAKDDDNSGDDEDDSGSTAASHASLRSPILISAPVPAEDFHFECAAVSPLRAMVGQTSSRAPPR